MNRMDKARERITEIKGDGFIIIKKGKNLRTELRNIIIEEAVNENLQRREKELKNRNEDK